MLKSLARMARTFVRALDTASAIRHGVTPKRYDDVVVSMNIDNQETAQPNAA